MLRKTIKYTDYDGNQQEEEFLFNLNKAEVAKMEFGTVGGLEQLIKKIIKERNNKELMNLFEDFILSAYGEKSLDGKYFEKSPEKARAFSQTEAYAELFVELFTDPNAMAAFVNGIVPQMPVTIEDPIPFPNNN